MSENPHLLQPVSTWGQVIDRASHAAILVHGRGQDPSFMVDVAKRLDLPDLAYLLPQAAGGTWYPERFMAPLPANEPWLGYAIDRCVSLMADLEDRGFPADRTALVGFSQGACLLAEYVIRNPRRYGAVALLTGGFIGPPTHQRTVTGHLAGTPAYLGSSRHDDWVPISRVLETAELLRQMGADVTQSVHENTEHTVTEQQVAETHAVLQALLGSESGSRPGGPGADSKG